MKWDSSKIRDKECNETCCSQEMSSLSTSITVLDDGKQKELGGGPAASEKRTKVPEMKELAGFKRSLPEQE